MESQDIFLLYEKEVAEFKLKLIQRLSEGELSQGEVPAKRTSNISLVENVLKNAEKPLHVNDIIDAVKKEFDVDLERDSLSSALNKYDHKEKRFIRVAPNTFGLRQT
jgi:DNA-directed RNA polymerase delta subunit